MRQVLLTCYGSAADVVLLTAAVRDLSLSHPNAFRIAVRTNYKQLWENNPHLGAMETESECDYVECRYAEGPLSNSLPFHSLHAFRLLLCDRLGVPIKPFAFKGDLHLTDFEMHTNPLIEEATGSADCRYWIIVTGGKKDRSVKLWETKRYQEIVDHFEDRVLFVQCGSDEETDCHPALDRVVNLVGKSNIRQLLQLVYHADGIVCPVSLFMHLAAAVPTKPGRVRTRPAVVIAGGREPAQWEAYPNHQYLHRCGCLPCCDNGGCWCNTVQVDPYDSKEEGKNCLFPVPTTGGRPIPKCMDMVTSRQVIRSIENYLRYDAFAWRAIHAPLPTAILAPPSEGAT